MDSISIKNRLVILEDLELEDDFRRNRTTIPMDNVKRWQTMDRLSNDTGQRTYFLYFMQGDIEYSVFITEEEVQWLEDNWQGQSIEYEWDTYLMYTPEGIDRDAMALWTEVNNQFRQDLNKMFNSRWELYSEVGSGNIIIFLFRRLKR